MSKQDLAEVETPVNTDLAETADQPVQQIQAQPIPTTVSPLVAMLASGQLTTELVDQALDLQERHDAYEAKKLFNIAISNFRSCVTNVVKDSKSHNARYASLGAIAKAISEPLGTNGLSYYWTQSEYENIITVKCHLTHAAGHSIDTGMSSPPDTSGSIKGIQAKASAITYLKRYTLTSLLGLATEDDDGEAAVAPSKPAVKYINEKQESELVDLMDAATEKLGDEFAKRFMGHYKSQFDESDTPFGLMVPVNRFAGVKKAIKSKMDAAKETEAKQEEPL